MMNWSALQKGVKFTLPDTGLDVWLRPVDFTIYALYSGLTDELLAIVLKAIQESDGQITLEAPTVTDVGGNLLQSRRLMEGYAKCAFVTPRVVDDPQTENDISPKWLSWGDLQFVYGMFNASLPELLRFSEEQAKRLLAVSDQPVSAHTP